MSNIISGSHSAQGYAEAAVSYLRKVISRLGDRQFKTGDGQSRAGFEFLDMLNSPNSGCERAYRRCRARHRRCKASVPIPKLPIVQQLLRNFGIEGH